MKDSNPTTRTYPRTLDEAFPSNVQHEQYLANQESIYKDEPASSAEFWVYMTLSFCAGFLVHLLWGAK